MSTLRTTSRAVMLAVPAALIGFAANAGGIAQPVAAAPVFSPSVPVAVASGRDWSGFYVGGALGYADLESSDILNDDFSGTTYGAFAGYNYDLGSIVLGAELEGTFGDFNDGDGVDFDKVLRAKARAGYDAGAFLPYLTAGYATGSVSAGEVDLEDDGYFYGAGVDYAFSDSITVGGEVLQHEFDNFEDTGADVDALTATLRVSYNF